MSNSTVSGMAARIRAATESETFDLAGQNATTISNTMQGAFSTPFPVLEEEEMIRITFVVGAGKQARQRYGSDTIKAVTSALRDLGYEEDRAASCVRECGGLYKLQHDTGKNLKTVVVFPKFVSEDDDDDKENQKGGRRMPPLLAAGSPEDRIAKSSLNVFKTMIASKCTSWSQKKGCMAVLESLRELLNGIDQKLVSGTPLTPPEQAFWETLEGLDDKETHVKAEMLLQVESGQITQYELDMLLEHNAERIASIRSEKGKLTPASSPVKRQKYENSLAKAKLRRDLLEQTDPIPPHKLKNDTAIRKLWKELIPLLKAEQQCRGRLLDLKESQMMARKEEIEEEIEELELASRGWFEDDDVFESRVEASRAIFAIKAKSKSVRSTTSSGTGVTSISSSSTTKVAKFVTPGDTGKGKSKSTKKRGKAKGADVFARLVIDSDDDEEDDDDDVEQHDANREPETRGPPQQSNETEAQSPTRKSGKKKKNKKKKSSKLTNLSEEEALQRAIAVNVAEDKKKKREKAENAWWSILFFSLLACLTQLIFLIVEMGTSGSKQKEDGGIKEAQEEKDSSAEGNKKKENALEGSAKSEDKKKTR